MYNVVNKENHPKLLELIRVPIRLGTDVFETGKISDRTIERLKKMATAYKLLMEVYEVDHYRACATSAFREAENGKEVQALLRDECGLKLEVISGKEEAELIFKANYDLLQTTSTVLFVDVGGGSTELTLFNKGEAKASQSFKIGSVRILQNAVDPKNWEKLQAFIEKEIIPLKPEYVLGTGGNIRKLFGHLQKKNEQFISSVKLKKTLNEISKLTYEERIRQLRFNPDRADVIVPALSIFQFVLDHTGLERIRASDFGMKDGIIVDLIEKTH